MFLFSLCAFFLHLVSLTCTCCLTFAYINIPSCRVRYLAQPHRVKMTQMLLFLTHFNFKPSKSFQTFYIQLCVTNRINLLLLNENLPLQCSSHRSFFPLHSQMATGREIQQQCGTNDTNQLTENPVVSKTTRSCNK